MVPRHLGEGGLIWIPEDEFPLPAEGWRFTVPKSDVYSPPVSGVSGCKVYKERDRERGIEEEMEVKIGVHIGVEIGIEADRYKFRGTARVRIQM